MTQVVKVARKLLIIVSAVSRVSSSSDPANKENVCNNVLKVTTNLQMYVLNVFSLAKLVQLLQPVWHALWAHTCIKIREHVWWTAQWELTTPMKKILNVWLVQLLVKLVPMLQTVCLVLMGISLTELVWPCAHKNIILMILAFATDVKDFVWPAQASINVLAASLDLLTVATVTAPVLREPMLQENTKLV